MKNLQLTSYLIVKDNVFPLRSGIRQEYLNSLLLFNTILEFLVSAVKQEKEMKGILTRKEEIFIYFQMT